MGKSSFKKGERLKIRLLKALKLLQNSTPVGEKGRKPKVTKISHIILNVSVDVNIVLFIHLKENYLK